ncbi:MAG: hypothetical protein KDB35_07815 [Acidimicrobiales bacterium]|nr:hypothetical protein [Acidimicrobiales bacterium]MCB1013863.1 hypothetical protein [Acidimicrobiales bacterium]MCB9373502.1 hypothetical protein [Microthrixaceae bacterium]
MSGEAVRRLAAFGVLLLVVFALGFGIGAATEPSSPGAPTPVPTSVPGTAPDHGSHGS